MQDDEDRMLFEGAGVRSGVRISVSTNWCVVNGSRYPVAELADLGLSRGPRSLSNAPGLVGLTVVAFVLVLIVLAIAQGWTRTLLGAGVAAVAGTVAVTALPAVLVRTLRRPYEIWARYRGTPVFLFGTYDREQFGQVSRALIRAHEAQDTTDSG